MNTVTESNNQNQTASANVANKIKKINRHDLGNIFKKLEPNAFPYDRNQREALLHTIDDGNQLGPEDYTFISDTYTSHINELLPDIKLIIQNLIETRKERDSNYEDMEYILYFIILFNQIEYLEEYKKLLEKSEDRDFYFDLLMQYLDSSWEISTEKILWPKDIKPLVEVIQLSKTDKTLAVQRLKKYLEKEWFKTLKEGLITNKQLEKGRYRGYWCIESAVLVKVLGLDDTDLRGCKYYPYDMAHFSE